MADICLRSYDHQKVRSNRLKRTRSNHDGLSSKVVDDVVGVGRGGVVELLRDFDCGDLRVRRSEAVRCFCQ